MEGLSTAITENLAEASRVSIFGLFTVSTSVITCWGITLFLALAAFLLTRNLKVIPGKSQMILESAVGFLNNFCKENIGKHWRPFAPWLGTVTLFILFSNLTGIIGIAPPTKNLTVTATLAFLSVLLIYGAQLRYRGFAKGLRQFAKPIPLLLPINLLEVLIRPLSLCMRLFGNILAGHIVMEMLHALVPLVVPVFFSLYFDIFDGAIQAIVFVFLTTLFVGEAIQDHDE